MDVDSAEEGSPHSDDGDTSDEVAGTDAPRPGDSPAFAAILDAADRGSRAPFHSEDQPPKRESEEHRRVQPVRSAVDDDPDAVALRQAVNLGIGASPVTSLEPGHPEFQSIVRQSVIDQVKAHADKHAGVEVCGVMVGTVYENPQTSFVYIDDIIRGESSANRTTQVTFTAETWQHIHAELEAKHPGKQIIGWYHTHPGFGIFLSEMDLFIQRHFFNAAWQVAFVFDPQGRDAGMFAWRQGQVRRVDFVLDDETNAGGAQAAAAALTAMPGATAQSAQATFHEDPAAPVNAALIEELADRVRVLEGRMKWLLAGFAIVLLAAIIWPLVVTVVMPAGKPADRSATTPADPARVERPDANFPLLPK